MGGSGDPANKTAEQVAIERRQRDQLNEEIAASERRLKATARGKLGKRSLFGQPMQPVAAPKGPTITEGYIKAKGGKLKKVPEGRKGRRGISAAVGGVASSAGAIGAVSGSKKAKKKALLGGLF
jgi:hypothetical protein